MNNYYCPYCNPKYQFSVENYGKLVCGLCGEDLIKKPIIQLKKLVSLLLVFSFSFPMIFLIFSSIFNKGKGDKENFAHTNQLTRKYKNLLPLHKINISKRELFSN
tara:strand:- start:221 stop:535 length:315 start_codon:yes stop_codon:yes gene_type:complete